MHTGTMEVQPEAARAPFDDTTTTRNRSNSLAPVGDDALTERSRTIWSAGDYDRIAAGFRHEAEAFVDRLGLAHGVGVLDAACGSGNLTIPAARTGAHLTGFDLVAPLLAQASTWAEREGLDIVLDQGSVERLPYGDGEFDVVMSMFGVMFAARPDEVVGELARVTRKGGRVALANWTRTSFVGQMFAIHGAFAPPPPNIPSPLLWGDEQTLRERFNARDWQLQLTPRVLEFRFPVPAAESAAIFIDAYGPTVRTMEMLDEAQRRVFVEQLTGHWEARNTGGGASTVVASEYLEVVAIRR
jgi:ubiquinone/menaquinone biosynthesis C-methylase UbiE